MDQADGYPRIFLAFTLELMPKPRFFYYLLTSTIKTMAWNKCPQKLAKIIP
jgi:hypothetical protein